MTARAVPASAARRWASRICPRICASPRTIESRPEATRKGASPSLRPPGERLLPEDGGVDEIKREKKAERASKLSGTSLTP